MKTVSKSLASCAISFQDTDGGCQAPARVRSNGAFVPFEKTIDLHRRTNLSLVVIFCAKEALGKNAN